MDREIIHILLVESSETHATTIRNSLEAGHAPVRLTLAPDIATARACLSKSLPHLAITDLSLPDGQAVELLPTTD